MCRVKCTVDSEECTVYRILGTVYSLHHTVYRDECTVDRIECIVYTVQGTVLKDCWQSLQSVNKWWGNRTHIRGVLEIGGIGVGGEERGWKAGVEGIGSKAEEGT